MALRPGRSARPDYDIHNTFTHTADVEAGLILCYKTANYGSGESLGQTGGQLQLAASSSGAIPVGVLAVPFQNVDETKFFRNRHNDSHSMGMPAPLYKKGYVVTDQIVGTPNIGDTAYLLSSGQMGPTMNADGGTAATPPVGRFESQKDEAGFARVEINLPWLG